MLYRDMCIYMYMLLRCLLGVSSATRNRKSHCARWPTYSCGLVTRYICILGTIFITQSIPFYGNVNLTSTVHI